MADKLRITTEQLTRDIAELNSNINTIYSAIEKIRTEGAVLNSMWDGPSHDVFIQQFEANLVAAEDLIKELKTYSAALETAKGQYDTCVNRVDGFINSIRL